MGFGPLPLRPMFSALGTIIVAMRGPPLGDVFSAMSLVPVFVGGIPCSGTRTVGVIALGEGRGGGQKSKKTQRSETHFALRFTGGGAGCVS
jgi:hypothetical protein